MKNSCRIISLTCVAHHNNSLFENRYFLASPKNFLSAPSRYVIFKGRCSHYRWGCPCQVIPKTCETAEHAVLRGFHPCKDTSHCLHCKTFCKEILQSHSISLPLPRVGNRRTVCHRPLSMVKPPPRTCQNVCHMGKHAQRVCKSSLSGDKHALHMCK